MNVIFVSIDSLNRHFLDDYPGSAGFSVDTPNLSAFARRSLTFDRHYAGSLPCMPARREFLTGTQEFLWRAWGPLEPFDRPIARVARENGVVSQLVTDHFHYFQHGSHGYYEDYSGWELIRGHEYDAWKTAPRQLPSDQLRQLGLTAEAADDLSFQNHAQYLRNVSSFRSEADFFAPKVFSQATEWLEYNARSHDRWFLYVDSFDAHEPFHVPEPYASMYTDEDPHDPELIHWPLYGPIDSGASRLSERQIAFARAQYAGKLTMVDRWFGRMLEHIDDAGLWGDTMIVVTSDHGHYLGEHGLMGKPSAPIYNTLANPPLWIWHPDLERAGRGGRCDALTSAVDIYATLLEALEIPVPEGRHSRSLLPLILGETDKHRDWALYGYWGKGVNVTDGHRTYLRAPASSSNEPLFNYSTMFMNPSGWFDPVRVQAEAESGRFLPYSDAPCWRYPLNDSSAGNGEGFFAADPSAVHEPGQSEDLLFDVDDDPEQERPVHDPATTAAMEALLRRALGELHAPEEQYQRLGL